MSMSSPDVQQKPSPNEPAAEVAAVPSESWSLLRWLIVAGLIVVVGGSAATLVKMMPTEGLPGEEAKKFIVNTKPDGPPGKAVLTEDPTYNFGVMAQKQKGKHTWILKNEGQGDLLLSMGDADCSCTIANFTDEGADLHPEGRATRPRSPWTWETRTFDGGYQEARGHQHPGRPGPSSVVFAVEGSVRPAIAVQPPDRVQTFAVIPERPDPKTKFAIASADKPDMKILKITTSSPDEIAPTAVPLPDADRKGLEWEADEGRLPHQRRAQALQEPRRVPGGDHRHDRSPHPAPRSS